jgi:hypothetical protein
MPGARRRVDNFPKNRSERARNARSLESTSVYDCVAL